MYDYWLGGKDNFEADRAAAERQAEVVPELPWLARQNRCFLKRAVRFCAGNGISQFLDIGSGLPTSENVHQVAQQVNPDSRVVYVDIDPVVVSHSRALLSDPGTLAFHGDVCRPDDILGSDKVRRFIDFSQPVGLLLVAVLHAIREEDQPFAAVARLREALAPGSFLVISHADVSPVHSVGRARLSEIAREISESNESTCTVPSRNREDVAAYFGDLTLVEPGLTEIWAWRPDNDAFGLGGDFMRMIGGVGRKD
jgi:hypothetical protein